MVTNYQSDSIIGRLDTQTNEIEEGANGFAGVIDTLAQGPPVAEGLGVTANYTDLTATVNPGVAVVRPGDGTAFLAQFSGAGVSLSGASVNEVYLTADPDASATAVAVDVRDDGTTPSLPHVRLATCDATTNTTTLRGRTRGDAEFDSVTTEQLGAEAVQVSSGSLMAFGGGSFIDTYGFADYADIFDATNAALTDGATRVIWPEGSYNASTTLDVDLSSGLTASGAGHVPTSGPTTRISFTGSGRAVDAQGGVLNLSDVRLFGPGSGGTETGIYSDTRSFISRVNINQFGTGLELADGSYYNNLQSIWCTNNGTGLTTNSNTVHITAGRFNGNDTGLVADSFATFTMIGSAVEANNTRGVDLQGSYYSPFIMGNYFENNGSQSVRAVGTSADKGQGGAVSYNFFNTESGETGIRVANAIDLSVKQNNIIGSGDLGVFITPDAEDTRFSGVEAISGVTNAVNDSGVRTLRNGIGENGSNDPASAGEWNGNGREGVQVKWDDGAGTDYLSVYRGGQWWDWQLA